MMNVLMSLIGLAVAGVLYAAPPIAVGVYFKSARRALVTLAAVFLGPTALTMILIYAFEAAMHPTGEASVGYGFLALMIGVPIGWLLAVTGCVLWFVVNDRRGSLGSRRAHSA